MEQENPICLFVIIRPLRRVAAFCMTMAALRDTLSEFISNPARPGKQPKVDDPMALYQYRYQRRYARSLAEPSNATLTLQEAPSPCRSAPRWLPFCRCSPSCKSGSCIHHQNSKGSSTQDREWLSRGGQPRRCSRM